MNNDPDYWANGFQAVVAEFVCTTAFLFIVIGHVTFSCHASDVGQGSGVAGGEVGGPLPPAGFTLPASAGMTKPTM
jgi:hypothetical protein